MSSFGRAKRREGERSIEENVELMSSEGSKEGSGRIGRRKAVSSETRKSASSGAVVERLWDLHRSV